MSEAIVRTDKWGLQPSPDVRLHLSATVNKYRAYCKALSYVAMGHWPELAESKSFCAAVERLIHPTSQHPHPQYSYFEKRFYTEGHKASMSTWLSKCLGKSSIILRGSMAPAPLCLKT